jgi:hypothetical protein
MPVPVRVRHDASGIQTMLIGLDGGIRPNDERRRSSTF